MSVLNPITKRLENKEITYVPGLYKIFDEILVNASDNKQRDSGMDKLDVTIDAESNTISVRNNGKVSKKRRRCPPPPFFFLI